MVDDATSAGTTSRLRRGRSTLFVLGLGGVSWAWSEVGFWAHFRSDDNGAEWVIAWLLYTLAAGVVVRVLVRYPARALPFLVLAGAVYGWLVEGVLASTVYLALPFSIVWTGVAWHGLLTVVVGWWALPRALRSDRVNALRWSALIGVAWGLWSVGWWGAQPDDGQLAVTPQLVPYVGFVVAVTAAAALGYAAMASSGLRAGDLTSRWMTGLLVLALGLWGVAVVVIALPWAPLVLAVLLWVGWVSLRRLDRARPRGQPEQDTPAQAALGTVDVIGFDPGVPWRRLGPLAAVPACAIGTYAALSPFAPSATGAGVFYLTFVAMVAALSLLGAGALGWALWVTWRGGVGRVTG